MTQKLETRIDSLEVIVKELAKAQIKTEKEIQGLTHEMKAFKDEMLDFKNEMRDFKDEMLDFKNEMRDFKDEMLDFKNEMKDFKDEMQDFKEESKAERKRINKQWGELANKMGTLVEDIVSPNIPRIAKEYFGCDEIEDFMIRRQVVNKKDRSKRREFDVIAVCNDKIIVDETKSTPSLEYIREFMVSLKDFFDYFPEYKGKTIIPIFSSLYLSEGVIQYLTKNKIYAMGMSDETMEILNPGLEL